MALFSDGTELFRSPSQPDCYEVVRIHIRTALNNVDSVYLICGGTRMLMKKAFSEMLFDYYECDVRLSDQKITYYFEVMLGTNYCYYNQKGVVNEPNTLNDFVIVPGFKTPDWAKGAVFYQIFVDRFCNGDTSNDVVTGEYSYIGEQVVKVEEWGKYPAMMGVREFYGGDLKGIMRKLDYLQDLGIDVLYLNPIFVSPSNHKYDIQDYDMSIPIMEQS